MVKICMAAIRCDDCLYCTVHRHTDRQTDIIADIG